VCGIAGFEMRDGAAERAAKLVNALLRRGPDATTIERKGHYCFVQTRLAVIDLSDRVQYPIPNEDETVWLLYNGEIYNFRDLRIELERRGHRFRTGCDAEVALHAYEEWSLDAFERLNGMFAVAIFDEATGELVLARDRFGIKPLVRTTGRSFAFSSDVLALVTADLSRGEIDLAAMREYVTFHYVPPPKTGLTDVVQVEPGTALVRAADGSERVARWAPLVFQEGPRSSSISLEEADEVLATAVRRQLVADVPVGIFLSGGIDSSLVVSYAVDAGARPHTFTVAFSGHGDYDELPRAARVARTFGVPHEFENLAVEFAEAVDDVANAFDQPFGDSSAIATLAVSRLARPHVTVALTGTGGDDLFAGYYRHRAHRFRKALSHVPLGPVGLLEAAAEGRGRERRSAFSLTASYLRRLREAGFRSDLEQYIGLVGAATSPAAQSALSFALDPRVVRTGVALRNGLDHETPSRLRQLQRFELRTYVAGDLLVKEDRSAMAVGLEARVPMLDDEVARLAGSVSDRDKASLLRGKILLRKLAERRLGSPVSRVRKRGFAVPLGDLFLGRWRDDAEEWFRASASELVDGESAAMLLRDNRAGGQDLWALAALAGWERRVREARVAGPRQAGLMRNPAASQHRS
jgi:asparagine synthase (glutamine-hydrolysing)